jgi:cephalosporin-C deacetylase-like acetyl esterase
MLLLIVVFPLALSAAEEDWTLLEASLDAPPSKLLYRYLQAEAQECFDSRRQAVAALATPADVERRQADLRGRFLAALGGFPDKTPLNARVVGQERRDGYSIEKVVYESRPSHHVTAVLYLPFGEPPFPGVIVPCGHSANGKAAEPYQRACILMATNGVAVLCYDPIGQGERSQLLTSEGKPAVPGSTSEHTLVGVGALLVGKSTATYRIWDGIRSLDYLASRPEIDPARLGCTGNSGGGTLTSYLMALDERILAAAPSCYLTTLERLFATLGPQDAEQNITGQVAFGMDHADYVTMRAPRPTLMCVGTQDYFDIDGAWTTFREAKRVYGVLGYGERVDLFEYNDKHGFSLPRRQAAMRWMRRWLLDKNDAPTESDFPIATDAEMLCTNSGQVLTEFRGKSAFDLNAEEAAELARRRSRAPADPATIRRLLAIDESIEPAARRELGTAMAERYRLTRRIYQPAEGIPLPALLFEPATAAEQAQPLVIYLHDEGKAADAGPGGEIEKLVAEGRSVLAVDLRGWGETAPGKPAANRPGSFGVDSKEFFLGVHLNRPLLGQRVYDVLSIVASLASEKEQQFELIGIGAAGPVALHAAAMETRIAATTARRSIASWTSVAMTPLTVNQLANVVPGVLKHYDLPEVAAAIAPRKVSVVDPLDPRGQPITQ